MYYFFDWNMDFKMLNLRYDYKKLKFRIFGFTIAAFPALSGPYGKGPAPLGEYKVTLPINLSTTEESAAYTKEGFAFWAKIEPQFNTERHGLGIHPDGNVIGTLGCIGVTEDVIYCFALLYVFKKFQNNLRLVVG